MRKSFGTWVGYGSDSKRAWKIILGEDDNEVSCKYFLYEGDYLLSELDSQLRAISTSTWGVNGLVSRATNSYDRSVAERVTDNGSALTTR